mmetsp:Transcript_19294/g.23045  ORF Transcript_19294/g.23045 Transcript_19294/m.23045 type:complete len:177 (-) Transcript_19294:365-895(-)|eukprot:CAMPEP_0197847976 /NCGR_PEP_ID=MMETSP1438-20131217/7658_1 /TAXON_ID=1461541 /ORGANISM="Pterosperma sp., Strain CCMP1384" /LENGTH=176 /DNA_ID=CAMNT_0043460073 /DNA_START=103 /DNA_END=633 /DNA_ORIENTATION=+
MYTQIPSTSQEAAELVRETKSSKGTVLSVLFALCFLVAATFGAICLATEYSKELNVVAGDLMEKSTGAVVSTRPYEAAMDAFTGADSGFKWITVAGEDDGDASRFQVVSVSKTPCYEESASCVDGFRSLFKTPFGTFLGSVDSQGNTVFSFVAPEEAKNWFQPITAETKAVITGKN